MSKTKIELPESIKKDIKLTETIATFGFNAALWYCVTIGLGNYRVAMMWAFMYVGSFIYIRAMSKKIKHDMTYTVMLSMGEEAKGRWE